MGGVYQTFDDRFIALAPLEEKFWIAFCNTVEKPGWIERQYEGPMPQRPLIEELQKLFKTKTAEAANENGVELKTSSLLD